MKEVREIAQELSKGNIEKAGNLRTAVHFKDKSLELEVLEIARQAVFSYFKKGEIVKALQAQKVFKISSPSVDEALKQAILSNYREGNLRGMIKIRDTAHVSQKLRKEIVGYCESWKNQQKEAEAMKKVFLG